MKCNCIHANVCRHRTAIDTAIHPIIEIVYGPGNIANQVEFERAIQKVCKFKTDNRKEEESIDDFPIFDHAKAIDSLNKCFFDGEAWVVNEPPKEPPNVY